MALTKLTQLLDAKNRDSAVDPTATQKPNAGHDTSIYARARGRSLLGAGEGHAPSSVGNDIDSFVYGQTERRSYRTPF
jgi:hypothetical protein